MPIRRTRAIILPLLVKLPEVLRTKAVAGTIHST